MLYTSSVVLLLILFVDFSFDSRIGFHVTESTCYLTADLFYLEVVLEACGGVKEVKLAPQGAPPTVSPASHKPFNNIPVFIPKLLKWNCFADQWATLAATEVKTKRCVSFRFFFFFFNVEWWTWSCFYFHTQVQKLCWFLQEISRPLCPVQHPWRQVNTRPKHYFLQQCWPSCNRH